MGHNPADGQSEGGMTINREIYNQFRRNDSQLPNNYYEVEITADELELMKSYLANPENNRYSLFNKNCASGAVDMWNTTLADRPEYKLTANYSTIATEPMSLYFELGQMANKNLDGKAGTNFVPHTVRYTDEIIDTIEKIKAIGEVELTDECKAKIDSAREAYDALTDGEKERVWNYDDLVQAEQTYEALKKAKEDKEPKALIGDVNNDGIVDVMDSILIQRYTTDKVELTDEQLYVADVNDDGQVDVIDAMQIQKYSVEKITEFDKKA